MGTGKVPAPSRSTRRARTIGANSPGPLTPSIAQASPILSGATPADWRKGFYFHYYEFPADHRVRPHCGVITDRYTLAHFYAPDVDCWELFDRAKDAGEMRNVFGEPAYAAVQTNLLEEVSHLRTKLKEPPTDDPKAFGRATEF